MFSCDETLKALFPNACSEPVLGGLVSSKCSALKNNYPHKELGPWSLSPDRVLWEPFPLERQTFSFHLLTEPSFLPQTFAPGLYGQKLIQAPKEKVGRPCPAHILFADPCSVVESTNTLVQGVCVWCGGGAHGRWFSTAYLCSVRGLALVSGIITSWYHNDISRSDDNTAWSKPQQSDLILQTWRWVLLLHRTSGRQVDGAGTAYIVRPGWECDLLG